MTIVAANWVGENTSTLGTGPLALSGAISTFCPFSVLPDGSEVYYTLQEGFNRETGIGVVSNGTLTRKVQATLVAGVYTETNIPISLVGNGQVFAVINADFMTRIYNFSLDVADSVAAAAASAKASADSAALANNYETQSEQNAENASLYAQSSSDSKIAADESKTAAANSASAAANSQADALASKNAAKTSETNSKNSETAAANSASAAANSQADALASKNAANTAKTGAEAAAASVNLPPLGIGLLTQTDIANFDWQNFVFMSGANYVTSYNTWVNPPAGITYNTGTRVSIRVIYISTTNGPRMGLELTPDTGSSTNFKVYKLLCVGAAGSRVFTFNQDWNSANAVPITGGGTGATNAAGALSNLGFGSFPQYQNLGVGQHIIQHGYGVTNSSGIVDIVFPKAFTTTDNLNVIATATAVAPSNYIVTIGAPTLTGVRIYATGANAGVIPSAMYAIGFKWVATGR